MLKEKAMHYYVDLGRSCSESILMAANDVYHLNLTDSEIQLFEGFRGGMGCGAACGCLTGAILGARMGEETLPDFDLEGLEITGILREMADDLMQGCPMVRNQRLFDADWEQKYLNGGF